MGIWHDLFTPSTWFGGSGGGTSQNTAAQLAAQQANAAAQQAQTSALNNQSALVAQQTASAKAAADAALKAQNDANLIAQSKLAPQFDSESAVLSGEDRKRKLLQGSSFGIGLPTQLGAPPVGFRMLSGQ